MSQQQTDDLRVLKAEETLDLTNNTASLPLIYRHMLSCTVNFRVLKNYSCFTAGTILSYGAGRMTTDMQTLIRQNHYFKPTYFRPYYYITKDKIIIYADKESIFSFSKRTEIPSSFRCRTVFSRSTVLRAKREIDFVRTMSILPASQSSIMRWNSSRLLAFVPLIPLSAYTPTYCQPWCFCISSL